VSHLSPTTTRAIAAGIGVDPMTVVRDLRKGVENATPGIEDDQAIAAATGVGQTQVRRDLAGEPFGSPDSDDDQGHRGGDWGQQKRGQPRAVRCPIWDT
jgi:hypothetical protein